MLGSFYVLCILYVPILAELKPNFYVTMPEIKKTVLPGSDPTFLSVLRGEAARLAPRFLQTALFQAVPPPSQTECPSPETTSQAWLLGVEERQPASAGAR